MGRWAWGCVTLAAWSSCLQPGFYPEAESTEAQGLGQGHPAVPGGSELCTPVSNSRPVACLLRSLHPWISAWSQTVNTQRWLDSTSLPPSSRAPYSNVETRGLMAVKPSLNTDSLEKEGFFSKWFWDRISILVEVIRIDPHLAPHMHHNKCQIDSTVKYFLKENHPKMRSKILFS